MYLNKVQLYGNLTRDPELKTTTNGTQVVSLGIATNRNFTKDGQRQEQTEFHNIVAFGKTAEVIGQYLKKGDPMYIDGRLQTRSWDKDGVKQYRTEIITDSFQFGPKEKGVESKPTPSFDKTPDSEKTYASSMPNVEVTEEINPEDIPF